MTRLCCDDLYNAIVSHKNGIETAHRADGSFLLCRLDRKGQHLCFMVRCPFCGRNLWRQNKGD